MCIIKVFTDGLEYRTTDNTGRSSFSHEQLLAFPVEVVLYKSEICIFSAEALLSNTSHSTYCQGFNRCWRWPKWLVITASTDKKKVLADYLLSPERRGLGGCPNSQCILFFLVMP